MNKEFRVTLFTVRTGTEDGNEHGSVRLCTDDEMNDQRTVIKAGKRKTAFILASTDHGMMIVNRFDYKMVSEDGGYGVGFSLLNTGTFEPAEIAFVKQLLDLKRGYCGDGVRVLDIGANIGVHTVSWARHMAGWGTVLAVEPQEPLFYALCGNIVINNCANAKALWAACGATDGCIDIPQPDYMQPGTFGSLELRKAAVNEDIGQPVDYENNLATVPILRVDSLREERVDLIKIDVENMEPEVLEGACETVLRCRPLLMVETFKSEYPRVLKLFENYGYHWMPFGLSLLALHQDDPVRTHVKWEDFSNGE
jgi:FkbM family methyltransferase